MFIPSEPLVLPPPPPSDGSPAYILCLEPYEDVGFMDLLDALPALKGFGRHQRVFGAIIRHVDLKMMGFTMPGDIPLLQGRARMETMILSRATSVLTPIPQATLKRYVPSTGLQGA